MLTYKNTVLIALASGFLAVLLGAFGAHALKAIVAPTLLVTWKTASFYHFVHTVVLLLLAFKQNIKPLKQRQFQLIAWAFILGLLLFSGSLYAYVISQWKVLAMLTPIGGLCFLGAWSYWFICELGMNSNVDD